MARKKTPAQKAKPPEADVNDTPPTQTDADTLQDAVETVEEVNEQPEDVTQDAAEDAAPTTDLDDAPQDTPEVSETEDEGEGEDTAPTEDSDIPAPQAQVQTVRRGGFVPMVLGGVICAALGYGGAQFLKPEGWPFPGASTQELTTRIDALEATIASLEAANGALKADLDTTTSALSDQVARQVEALDLDAKVAPLSQDLASLADRLSTLEAKPVAEAVVSPEATAAYEAQLAEMRALLESEVSRLSAAEAAAAEQAAQAQASTALAALHAAVDQGVPFEAFLGDIAGDVPQVLQDAAAQGITGVTALQNSFAPAARTALSDAAKASYETGEQGFVQTFLRTQLGLRSLEPKEGDTPDAILSRAEAAVQDARFADAIAELDKLPEAGKAAMAQWVSLATERVAVTDALSSLTAN